MKIGLFGGSFDPIHLGHVDMIEKLRALVALDRVVFIPAYIPPHKQTLELAPYAHRLAMTALAVKGDERFSVSDYEGKKEGLSYTLETIEHFKQTHPEDTLYEIMGADSFNAIETWHHWQELLMQCHFIVIDRPSTTLRISPETDRVLAQSPYEVRHLPLSTLPISSTMVRQRLVHHESVDDCLAPQVIDYIKKHHLYGW